MPKTIQHSTRTRGYLPHWEAPNATYFVTFRLADSLPQHLLAQLHQDQNSRAATTPADRTRAAKRRALLKKAEDSLDSGNGECHLRDPRIAKIVADTLRHFASRRYQLRAWCVMPNHVHVLFSPHGEHTLHAILHSWKSYSAQEINKLLRRIGPFWQREYFDHIVRNDASEKKIIEYIRNNPQKAGLTNWPWMEIPK